VVVPDVTSRVSLLASGNLDASTVVLNSGAALAAPAVLAESGAGSSSSSASSPGAPAADSSSANATVATAGATQSPVEGAVTVTSDGNDSMGALVNSLAPGYLVVADSDQVGWSATVDGKAARLVPADQGLVAVSVPAGTHTVKLRYKSPDNGIGGYASAATAFALAGGVGVETWCSRRGRSLPWEVAWTRGRVRRAAVVVPGGGATGGSGGGAGSGDGDARGPDVREDASV